MDGLFTGLFPRKPVQHCRCNWLARRMQLPHYGAAAVLGPARTAGHSFSLPGACSVLPGFSPVDKVYSCLFSNVSRAATHRNRATGWRLPRLGALNSQGAGFSVNSVQSAELYECRPKAHAVPDQLPALAPTARAGPTYAQDACLLPQHASCKFTCTSPTQPA